jgi:gluconokinase
VALTMGTTGAMRAILDKPVTPMPKGLWCYRIDKQLSLLGGSLTDTGSLLDWLHRALRMRGSRVEDREIASVEPNSHGLTVLPFIRGERSPGWASDATATWHGVTASTTAAHMARAALEAVTYRFVLISRLLDQTAPDLRVDASEVVAGGAAILALPSWMQMMADATGKRIVASPDRGTTSRGIAILALKAMGVISSVADIPRADGTPATPGGNGNGNDVYEPNPAAGERYAEGLQRHNDLYARLIGDR